MKKKYINLLTWYKTARWREEVEYHRGFLMSDRKTNIHLSECADIALRCCETGHLILFQRKIGPNVYSYVARRSKKK